MTKLHELLAVEGNLENQADKCRKELMATFEKKRHLFEEKRVVFTPTGEGAQPTTESQSDIQSTINKELQWLASHLVKSLDASYQVAEANTQARADVVLDDDSGVTILKDIPATALLELEKRIVEIQNVISSIPTLDPAKGFVADEARGDGIYRAREVKKNRTQKVKKVFIKYEATKEHPAQTELLDQDVVVGSIQEQEWSGLITPARKSELLNKAEMLGRAIRRARSRANEVEVQTSKKIGKQLIDFILK